MDILNFGHTVTIKGIIFNAADHDSDLLFYLPDDAPKKNSSEKLTLEQWKKIIRQLDILETEILAKDETGLVKTILRKTTRQIDQKISWKVFKRDNYKCRYCANDDAPLTVDHLILWEHGGPSIEENLVAACKKCNKRRGDMLYKDWLKSTHYLKKLKNLSLETKELNEQLLDTLDNIPLKIHKKSR